MTRLFSFLFFLGLTASPTFGVPVKVLEDVPSTYVYPADGFLPFNIHRGTQTMLSLMVPGALFNDPRGVACALLKSDHNPKDPTGDVVVTVIGVNSGAGEIYYNVGLKDIRRFGKEGRGNKQFLHPTGTAIHPNGNVAIADTGNNRVVLLRHDGLRLQWVKTVGGPGSGKGKFYAPLGVAYDSKGNLYIADTGNNRIQVMDPKGRCHVLETPPLVAPSALAVMDDGEEWTFYQNGPYANRLAVIDRQGRRLRTLTLGGTLLAETNAEELPDLPVKLWGCAFDYYGNVVATDFAGGRLRKFDQNLHYLTSFGGPGEEDFQFLEPRGIAFNRQFGQVIVAEKKSAQYFWNGTDAINLKSNQEDKKIRIPFLLTERAFVDAEVRTSGPGGVLVDTLSKHQELEEGPRELDWTPQPSTPPGDYVLKLRLMATYSSRERVAKEINLPVTYTK